MTDDTALLAGMTAFLEKTVPKHTKRVEFLWVKREFSTMCQQWRDARKRYRMKPMCTCFWCKHKFADGEKMALAARQGKTNVLLCQCCAEMAIRNADHD